MLRSPVSPAETQTAGPFRGDRRSSRSMARSSPTGSPGGENYYTRRARRAPGDPSLPGPAPSSRCDCPRSQWANAWARARADGAGGGRAAARQSRSPGIAHAGRGARGALPPARTDFRGAARRARRDRRIRAACGAGRTNWSPGLLALARARAPTGAAFIWPALLALGRGAGGARKLALPFALAVACHRAGYERRWARGAERCWLIIALFAAGLVFALPRRWWQYMRPGDRAIARAGDAFAGPRLFIAVRSIRFTLLAQRAACGLPLPLVALLPLARLDRFRRPHGTCSRRLWFAGFALVMALIARAGQFLLGADGAAGLRRGDRLRAARAGRPACGGGGRVCGADIRAALRRPLVSASSEAIQGSKRRPWIAVRRRRSQWRIRG